MHSFKTFFFYDFSFLNFNSYHLYSFYCKNAFKLFILFLFDQNPSNNKVDMAFWKFQVGAYLL